MAAGWENPILRVMKYDTQEEESQAGGSNVYEARLKQRMKKRQQSLSGKTCRLDLREIEIADVKLDVDPDDWDSTRFRLRVAVPFLLDIHHSKWKAEGVQPIKFNRAHVSGDTRIDNTAFRTKDGTLQPINNQPDLHAVRQIGGVIYARGLPCGDLYLECAPKGMTPEAFEKATKARTVTLRLYFAGLVVVPGENRNRIYYKETALAETGTDRLDSWYACGLGGGKQPLVFKTVQRETTPAITVSLLVVELHHGRNLLGRCRRLERQPADKAKK